LLFDPFPFHLSYFIHICLFLLSFFFFFFFLFFCFRLPFLCYNFNHFLQPSSLLATSQRLDQQCCGTTNIAGEGAELSCCNGHRPSLLADVTGNENETMVVAGSYQDATYPTVCLYDNRPPTPSSSFHV